MDRFCITNIVTSKNDHVFKEFVLNAVRANAPTATKGI